MTAAFRRRHLLGIEGLTRGEVEALLDAAEAFLEVSRRPMRKVPTLRGRTVINLFFEASTRTRTSFELAGKRLSADVVNVAKSGSSAAKGETLKDTVRTLRAMRPDVVVVRHGASGAAGFVARALDELAEGDDGAQGDGRGSSGTVSVVNAGDGQHEHPTQALLDAFTIRRRLGRLDGLTVTICGDVAHSRVARSNMHLLALFGADVRVVAPRTLVPPRVEGLGVTVFDRLEPALEGADVLLVLRLQRERMVEALVPSLREYSRTFGLNPRTLEAAPPGALILHPGPMNRGVEIESSVADGPRSLVLDQVEAGVAVRMAVLYQLAALRGATEEHTR